MNLTIKNKAEKYSIGHGYDLREKADNVYGIIIHSTNGRIGSSYKNEVDYLYNSPLVTAQYIISKDGLITQLLPIEKYRAWHAGIVNDPRFDNNDSIGIELHYTPGEDKNLPLMMKACEDLCSSLLQIYIIYGIKTHRELAPTRKVDPSNLSNQEFDAFVCRVYQQSYPELKRGK